MKKQEIIQQINALADRLEINLARRFLEGVQNVKNSLPLKEIARLIQDGQYSAVLQIVNNELIDQGFTGFSQAVIDSYVKSGNLSAKMGVEYSAAASALRLGNASRIGQAGAGVPSLNAFFNVTNPETARVLNNYRMSLIQQVTVQVQNTVREELTESILDGVNPLDSARNIRDSIGLTSRQRKAVSNFRKALNRLNSGDSNALNEILSRKLRDKRFDATLKGLLKNNKNLSKEQIEKMVSRYTEKYIKYRSEVIARTESIRTLNIANKQHWQSLVDEGRIPENRLERLWINTKDSHTRDAHVYLGNKYGEPGEGVGLNEPFIHPELGSLMYPGDPNGIPENTIQCRCTVFTRIKPDVSK